MSLNPNNKPIYAYDKWTLQPQSSLPNKQNNTPVDGGLVKIAIKKIT